MSNIETGGPAFPGEEDVNYPSMTATEKHTGMTLRDYFAAKAMGGELASPSLAWGEGMADQVAKNAYAIADAMLKARQ